jgi:hypothetical protein
MAITFRKGTVILLLPSIEDEQEQLDNVCLYDEQGSTYFYYGVMHPVARTIKTIKIKLSFATIDKMYLFLLITICFGSHKWPSSGDSHDTKYQSRSYYSNNGHNTTQHNGSVV